MKHQSSVFSTITTIVMPIALLLISAVRVILRTSVAFVPILPFELTAYFATSSLFTSEESKEMIPFVAILFLLVLLICHGVMLASAFVDPEKKVLWMLLRFLPLTLDLALSLLLGVISGMILCVITTGAYTALLLISSGIFSEKKQEQKDLSFYDRY